jgi:hypothetical protein
MELRLCSSSGTQHQGVVPVRLLVGIQIAIMVRAMKERVDLIGGINPLTIKAFYFAVVPLTLLMNKSYCFAKT